MVNKIVSIPGYVHLYRSLLRFYHTSENEIKEMLYVLNTANLDCFGYYHPNIYVVQSGPALFSNWLDNMRCRPYRTEVQLYKALYKAFGVEIDDNRTVYNECVFGLVPDEDEPSVCLMHDWVYLPTA